MRLKFLGTNKMARIELRVDQLKDFQVWKAVNSDAFSLGDYLFGVSNLEAAIAFTKLFWIDSLIYEEGIFLADGFSVEIYKEWKEQLNGNITSIEKTMNFRYVDDLLPGIDDISRNNVIYFGQALADMWESKLTKTFSGKLFSVVCSFDEDDQDGKDGKVAVTFSQIRS